MTIRRFLLAVAVIGGVLLYSPVAVVLFLAAWWVVCAYFWPYAPCWRCRGSKSNPGSSRKRFGSCKECKGSGMRQVAGSKAVHRAVRGAANSRKTK